MNKVSVAIKVAILPLAVLALQTQTSHAADGVELTDNGLELTVTANRRPETIDKTLASVTVITRKQIEETQTQDIVDLLRQQNGISVARTGSMGSATSLFIRGTESDHVLVLLDGVRIMSTTTGFDFSQLPLDQVERIEIVRGPRAALYGSDAIGGVVEITTRKNSRPYVSTTIGKYNTKKISAGYSASNDIADFSINLSKESSDGYSSQNENGFSYEADDDGYDKTSIGLSLDKQFTDKHKAGIRFFRSDGNVAYDNASDFLAYNIDNAKDDTELRVIEGSLSSEMSKNWTQKISVSETKNEFLGSSGYSDFSSKRNEVNWQNNITLSKNTSAIIGANYRDESGKSASISTNSIFNKALYANYNIKQNAFNFDMSLRHDDHSQAGSKVTGQTAVGYSFADQSTAYMSYGSGFRAPNLNDLYTPDSGGDYAYAGNPDLEPEKSKTFEVGVKYKVSNNSNFEASLFKTDVSNLISNSGERFQAINIDKVTLKGLELGYKGNFKWLDIGMGLTLLDTENKATGDRLLRRPDNKFNLNVGYSVSNKTRLGIDGSVVGSRSDVGGVELDSYSLLNLSMDYKLSKHAKIGLRVENVTDEDYELAYGFNTSGRGAYLTLTFQ